jgi:hypothetical protein
MFHEKPTQPSIVPARSRHVSDAETGVTNEKAGVPSLSEPERTQDRGRMTESHWESVIDRATD